MRKNEALRYINITIASNTYVENKFFFQKMLNKNVFYLCWTITDLLIKGGKNYQLKTIEFYFCLIYHLNLINTKNTFINKIVEKNTNPTPYFQ